MKMISTTLSAVFGAVMLSAAVSGQTLVLNSANVIGTGCPPGAASAAVVNNKVVVSGISKTQFLAQAGPGLSASQNRKNCDATLSVQVPAGFQFAFGATEYSAVEVQLTSPNTALIGNKYHFQSQIEEGTGSTTFNAGITTQPQTINYDNTAVWSACGGASTVILNSEIRANNAPNRQGNVSAKADGTISTSVVWRAC